MLSDRVIGKVEEIQRWERDLMQARDDHKQLTEQYNALHNKCIMKDNEIASLQSSISLGFNDLGKMLIEQ